MIKKFTEAFFEFFSQEGSLFRYSLSFCFLLALFPSLIVVIVLFQNEILDIQKVLTFVYQYLPKELIEPFVEYVMAKNYSNILSVIITLSVSGYLASNSIYSFMLISANHEKFETYGILIRIKAILLFIIIIVGVLVIGVTTHLLQLNILITILVVFIFGLYVFYRTLSFERRPWQFGVPGAVFSTVAMILVGLLFFYIIKTFTSYHTIYGPLASVVVLLLSIYVFSSIIYFGYCLNDVFTFSYPIKKIKMARFYEYGEYYIDKITEKFSKRR